MYVSIQSFVIEITGTLASLLTTRAYRASLQIRIKNCWDLCFPNVNSVTYSKLVGQTN